MKKTDIFSWRNCFAQIILGNVWIFYSFSNFPNEDGVLLISLPLFFGISYLVSRRKFIGYFWIIFGAATHPWWFEPIGHQLDMVYKQYYWDHAFQGGALLLSCFVIMHGIVKSFLWLIRE